MPETTYNLKLADSHTTKPPTPVCSCTMRVAF